MARPGGSVILIGGNALGGTLVVDGGTLQLPGGSLTTTSTASGYEYVGYSGTATFTQTGGTNTVGTAIVLGQNPGSVGNYNLLGGLLVVPSIVQGLGSGSLNITGGSLTAATGALTVASPIVLSAAGSNGTFNTSGSSITLAGQISGAGGLTKVGSSTLVLAAANTYTGGTTVAQGTLLLTNSNAAQNTSINVAVDNGLQFAGVGTFNIGTLGGAATWSSPIQPATQSPRSPAETAPPRPTAAPSAAAARSSTAAPVCWCSTESTATPAARS